MQQRIIKMKNARIREEGGRRYLEGYFAVFGEQYQVWDGWMETIERGAFAEYLASGEEAVNAYARIARGDVNGCSFGFEIDRQEEWWDEQGVYHTKILRVDPLYEVSPCTFPAYKATSITARNGEKLNQAREDYEQAKNKKQERWRESMRKRLKGE